MTPCGCRVGPSGLEATGVGGERDEASLGSEVGLGSLGRGEGGNLSLTFFFLGLGETGGEVSDTPRCGGASARSNLVRKSSTEAVSLRLHSVSVAICLCKAAFSSCCLFRILIRGAISERN